MSTFEQSPVSKVVWPWAVDRSAQKPASLWKRGLMQAVSMWCVAAIFFVFGENHWPGCILSTLGIVVLVLSVAWPKGFTCIEKLALGFGALVGKGLTWLLLVPFYYLFFTVGRLMLLVTKRDPMNRAMSDQQASYWEDKPKKEQTPESYRKQYV